MIDIPVNYIDSETQRKRCIRDIITVYNSDRFTNVKNNTLRTIDLLYHLGYYKDSESFFTDQEIK